MLEVLVVMVVVSITSEKVTDMDELTATNVPESEGEVEETVGAVVSMVLLLSVFVVLEFSVYSSLSSPHEIMVRLKKHNAKIVGKKRYFSFFISD